MPKMINVLVTGIGGPTAQGVMSGLADEENITIVGVDRREVNSGRPFCHKFHQIPGMIDLGSYKNKIKEIVQLEKIDVIFPSLHEEIEVYASFKKELDVVVATPDTDYIHALNNKAEVYKLLEQMDLEYYIPKYFVFQNKEELKVVMDKHFSRDKFTVAKQVSGHGALGFALLTDRKTYLEMLTKGQKNYVALQDYCDIPHEGGEMVMEYLPGQEFSVDVYVYEGNTVTAVPRERTGVSSGLVLDGKVIYNEALIEAGSVVSEALIHTGFMNLQFIEHEGSYKLTDINPRFCGSQVMSLGAGVNFPLLVIEYELLQNKPDVHPKWGTRMLRYRDQFFIQE
jgi:carbamoyl-phosphate synthase large subunit